MFNEQSSAGRVLPGSIDLTDEEVNQIGALLRVLNALQNIDDVSNCDARVHATVDAAESRDLLRLCLADNQDAIEVLSEGPLAPLHPIALSRLNASRNLHQQARQASTLAERTAALNAAGVELNAARADMVDEVP